MLIKQCHLQRDSNWNSIYTYGFTHTNEHISIRSVLYTISVYGYYVYEEMMLNGIPPWLMVSNMDSFKYNNVHALRRIHIYRQRVFM